MDYISTWFAFDRSQRLLLGFESPIHAGIFIAVIIPWIRCSRWPLTEGTGKLLAVGSLILEVSLLYLLARTGSRGPMLALLAAYAAETALCFRAKEYRRAKLLLLRSVLAVIALALFVGMSGFGGRFAEAAAFADESIHNRLEILKHARSLLLLDPAGGVDWGWSGHHYSQWFEPLHLRYLYNSLSNEYLQIGVELGLPLLFIILACVCTVLVAPWFQSAPGFGLRGKIARMAHLSFFIFAAVSWTTSYRYSTTLNIMTLLVFIICACLEKALRDRQTLAVGIAGASCVIAGFLLIPPSEDGLRVLLRAGNIVELRQASTPASANAGALVFVDEDVLGRVYGQTLRPILGHPPFNGKMRVVLPYAKTASLSPGDAESCIAFGASVAAAPMINPPPVRHFIIAHPSVRPPENPPVAERITVILPAIDEAGVNESWLRFCEEQGVSVTITPGCGLDIQGRAETFFIMND